MMDLFIYLFVYLMPGHTWIEINIQTNIRGTIGETKVKVLILMELRMSDTQ